MKGILEWMDDENVRLDEGSLLTAKEVKAIFEKGIAKFKKEAAAQAARELDVPKVRDVYGTFAFKRDGRDIEAFSGEEAAVAVRTAIELLYGAICRNMGLNSSDLDAVTAKAYGLNLKDVQKFSAVKGR